MATEPWPETTPADFWEERYSRADRVWSGAPNRTLVDVVGKWKPGRSLDLGCGEGADVIWLAQRGWWGTGIDISATAIARARAAASVLGLDQTQVSFAAADLSTWHGGDQYDLVTASFLQSPVALSRADILRAAAELVAPGGHLLVISHAAAPPWSKRHHHAAGVSSAEFPTPEQEIADLALDPHEWTSVISEVRSRDAVGPDGQSATLEDSVVLLRRA